MLENIDEVLITSILKEENQKIKKEESLEEYLKSFKNESLTRMCIFKVFENEDFGDMYKVYNLNHKSKKFIINYIKPNIDKIWESFFQTIPINRVDLIKRIVDNDGLLEYTLEDFDGDLLSIMMFKNYALAKVEYNEKKEIIKLFMPKEFCDSIKLSLKNKKIMELNKRNNEIYDYTEGLLEAYGIIEIDDLYDMIAKDYKMNMQEFNKILESKSMIDECMYIYYDDDSYQKIICNIEFSEEEEAWEFFKKIKGTYKHFTKKEMEKLKDKSYINDLKSYQKLTKYLESHFEGFKEMDDLINTMLIIEYVTFAQLDEKESEESFLQNISEFFEANEKDKKEILNLMKEIYKECPKWKKRGNI